MGGHNRSLHRDDRQQRKVLSVYHALEKEGIPLEKFARVMRPWGWLSAR